MAAIGNLIVSVTANTTGLRTNLQKAEGMVKSAALTMGKLGSAAALGGLVAIGGAALSTGKKAAEMALEFQDATNAIITGTGASGAALEDMQNITRNLKGGIAGLGNDYATLGGVVAEANTRLGLTGTSLENFSAQLLEYNRLTGGDAVRQTQLVTRVMGDWGVEAENSAMLLDQLFGAGQAFGINVDDLASKVVQFGAPLRQMGFTLEESIAMFGKWEKEGVNAELVIGSLRIAAGNFARDNIPLQEGLQGTIDAIKNASSESEGLAIAMEVFGARAGPDMAAAIREGRFELEGAILALQGTSGGLEDASNRALTYGQRWELMTNQFLTTVQPAFEGFFTQLDLVGGPALAVINDGITRVYQAFGGEGNADLGDFANYLLTITGDAIITGIKLLAVTVSGVATVIERLAKWMDKLNIDKIQMLATLFTAGGSAAVTALGQMLGFAEGGIVPGRIGQAQLVMAHGGEEFRTPAQQQQRINNYNLTVNSMRSANSLTQEFTMLQAMGA